MSLGGIRRTGDRKLMEAAAGKFCFVHHEHLGKRQQSRRQSADDSLVNITLHVPGVMYIFSLSLLCLRANIVPAVRRRRVRRREQSTAYIPTGTALERPLYLQLHQAGCDSADQHSKSMKPFIHLNS